VHPEHHLSPEHELARYATHNNNRSDEKYVAFLEQLLVPFVQELPPESTVLDYGSGPSPVMAELLRERGFAINIFDPHFASDEAVLENVYNGIICSETAEHFYAPRRNWQIMARCLNPGGIVGIMTLLHDDEPDIAHWWYVQDPTHVVFYSAKTMGWIAEWQNWRILSINSRVVIFQNQKRDSQ